MYKLFNEKVHTEYSCKQTRDLLSVTQEVVKPDWYAFDI